LSLANLGTGTYKVTVTGSLESTSSRSSRMSFLTTPSHRPVVSNWFSLAHPTTMNQLVVGIPPLDVAHGNVSTLVLTPTTSTGRTTFEFSVSGASVFSVSVAVGPNSTLNVVTLTLQKTAN
jgi:hypothetical protein